MTTWRLTNTCGTGKGSNLTPAEVDGNFWDVEQGIAAIVQITPPDITTISQDDYALRITVSTRPWDTETATGTETEDFSYTYGPFYPPTVKFRFTGWYRANFGYQAFDILQRYDGTVHSGMYLVTQDYTSDAAFDPYAEATEGPIYHKIYGESHIFDIAAYLPFEMGAPGAETETAARELLYQIVAPRAFTIEETTEIAAGYVYIRGAPTEDLICSVQKNGVEIGNFAVPAGQHTAQISMDTETNFDAGDVLSVVRETASGGRDLSFVIRAVRI